MGARKPQREPVERRISPLSTRLREMAWISEPVTAVVQVQNSSAERIYRPPLMMVRREVVMAAAVVVVVVVVVRVLVLLVRVSSLVTDSCLAKALPAIRHAHDRAPPVR
jgi:hypothetical protein